MIQIHINPDKVEKILLVSKSEAEEDTDLGVWKAIRPLVDKIDRRLKREVRKVGDSQE